MILLNEMEYLTDVQFLSLSKLAESGLIESDELLSEAAIKDKIIEIKNKLDANKKKTEKILNIIKNDTDLKNGEKNFNTYMKNIGKLVITSFGMVLATTGFVNLIKVGSKEAEMKSVAMSSISLLCTLSSYYITGVLLGIKRKYNTKSYLQSYKKFLELNLKNLTELNNKSKNKKVETEIIKTKNAIKKLDDIIKKNY